MALKLPFILTVGLNLEASCKYDNEFDSKMNNIGLHKYLGFKQYLKIKGLIIILVLLSSCKMKQSIVYDVKPAIRPQFEKRVPNNTDSAIVDSFFKDWQNISRPISDSDFNKLDTIEKFGYEAYESLIYDTSFIGIGQGLVGYKYFLSPNIFRVSIAKNYDKKYDYLTYDSIETVLIHDFTPNLKLTNKTLYYTKYYQDTLPIFAEKYGVGGYIRLNSYLMSNNLKYYETAPLIRGLTYLTDTGLYIVDYSIGNNSYETLVKRQGHKWIKIQHLTILSSD